MDHWRIRLELLGPYATPLVSGTLFGQLCWAKLRRDGEAALASWLEPIRTGREPVLLSDVLPADLLPKPLLPPPPFDPARAPQHKAMKKKAYVTRQGFLARRRALSAKAIEPHLALGPEDEERRQAHNVVDRTRGTVVDRSRGTVRDEAGLYFLDEWWPRLVDDDGRPHPDRLRDLYLATTRPIDELLGLLAAVGEWGFGRDSTYGRGRFRILGHEPERELFVEPQPGDRLLSLSHGCWTEALQAPRYKLATHFGKLAIEAAMACGRPWKRPLLLMRPGATFAASGRGPLGAWLEGITHSDVPGILGYAPGHHAFHLTVPYREVSDAG